MTEEIVSHEETVSRLAQERADLMAQREKTDRLLVEVDTIIAMGKLCEACVEITKLSMDEVVAAALLNSSVSFDLISLARTIVSTAGKIKLLGNTKP